MHAIKFATACVLKESTRDEYEGWMGGARGAFSNKFILIEYF